jgi:hypothetical protein
VRDELERAVYLRENGRAERARELLLKLVAEKPDGSTTSAPGCMTCWGASMRQSPSTSADPKLLGSKAPVHGANVSWNPCLR